MATLPAALHCPVGGRSVELEKIIARACRLRRKWALEGSAIGLAVALSIRSAPKRTDGQDPRDNTPKVQTTRYQHPALSLQVNKSYTPSRRRSRSTTPLRCREQTIPPFVLSRWNLTRLLRWAGQAAHTAASAALCGPTTGISSKEGPGKTGINDSRGMRMVPRQLRDKWTFRDTAACPRRRCVVYSAVGVRARHCRPVGSRAAIRDSGCHRAGSVGSHLADAEPAVLGEEPADSASTHSSSASVNPLIVGSCRRPDTNPITTSPGLPSRL